MGRYNSQCMLETVHSTVEAYLDPVQCSPHKQIVIENENQFQARITMLRLLEPGCEVGGGVYRV